MKPKNLFSYFKRNEILAIDLSGDVVRAVVVKREGKKAVILAVAESSKSPQSTLDSLQIKDLLGKLGKYPRRAVLVSPEVKFLTAELPMFLGIKLSSDKLREAVRWEAQAYLDFSASEGLFGYQLQNGAYPVKKEFFNGASKSQKVTPVLITAISKDAYNRLNNICQRCRINLRSVYTKESIFIFSADHFSAKSIEIEQQYMPAVDAALQELKITSKGKLGINDRMSLTTRLKSRIHILPLVVVGLFALGFLTHYIYIKSSFWRYSSSVKNLEIEKREFEGNISTLKGLKSRIKDAYEKKRYLEEILPARHKVLLDLFNGIVNEIPYDIILDRISQETANIFFLEGSGLFAGSITSLVGGLGRLKATREAKLEAINEKKADAENTGMFVYQFKIKVVLK